MYPSVQARALRKTFCAVEKLRNRIRELIPFSHCMIWLTLFRDPHQVRLQLALRVVAEPIMSHANTLDEILLRLKARVSTISDGDTKNADNCSSIPSELAV